MTDSQKKEIKQLLADYIDKYDSQNKAANSMAGVSSATISQVLNNNWNKINNEMWRKLAFYVEWRDTSWSTVETTTFLEFTEILQDSRISSEAFGVVCGAGSGKTFTAKYYAKKNRRVYLLQCSEYWNRKNFLEELMTQMGRDFRGLRVSDMVKDIMNQLRKQDKPLIIMDEADKLNDSVLYFFITIFNKLEYQCGMVLVATKHLETRILRGVRTGKKGYEEIYSRIGRKFIELNGVGSIDVKAICKANGINDKLLHRKIYQESEEDLRRVRRCIHAELKARVSE